MVDADNPSMQKVKVGGLLQAQGAEAGDTTQVWASLDYKVRSYFKGGGGGQIGLNLMDI